MQQASVAEESTTEKEIQTSNPQIRIRDGRASINWRGDTMQRLSGTKKTVEQRSIEVREKIIAYINTSDVASTVQSIKKAVGLNNWESTKAICLELALEGKITALKTTFGYVFSKKSI